MSADSDRRVTILASVRNEEAHIVGMLENIRTCSADVSLVIVDDRSTDATRELIAKTMPEAVIVDGPGRGLAAALNAGAMRVETEFIARMDADDLNIPGRFELQVRALDEHAGWVACASAVIERDARQGERRSCPPTDPSVLRRSLLSGNSITHGSVMLRTAAFRQAGGYDSRVVLAQDYDLWLRLTSLGDMGVLEEPLYIRNPPTGKEYRRKRRRQSYYSALVQFRHFKRCSQIDAGAFVRNVAGWLWIGPRPTEVHDRIVKFRSRQAR